MYQPFSHVISPFVDRTNGRPTELGLRLLMSPEIAGEINGPNSPVVRHMQSLGDVGIGFEGIAGDSYSNFNYAKSAIALEQKTATAAPALPLLWLPLGNSLFIARVEEILDRNPKYAACILNLGSGPGALEQMISEHLSRFAGRLTVLSVEMDEANIKSLERVVAGMPCQHRLVKGDFTKRETQQDIMTAIPKGSEVLAIAGYSLHHIDPRNTERIVNELKLIARFVQVHEVEAGTSGGGQSPVNRLIFNFMTAYHLLVFHPDSFYTKRDFVVMKPEEAACKVAESPVLYVSGTTPENAEEMLQNGSVKLFRWENL